MAAVRVLVDTDVLIDYFNAGEYAALLDDRRNRIYYSVVTRKELLAKEGGSSAVQWPLRPVPSPAGAILPPKVLRSTLRHAGLTAERPEALR